MVFGPGLPRAWLRGVGADEPEKADALPAMPRGAAPAEPDLPLALARGVPADRGGGRGPLPARLLALGERDSGAVASCMFVPGLDAGGAGSGTAGGGGCAPGEAGRGGGPVGEGAAGPAAGPSAAACACSCSPGRLSLCPSYSPSCSLAASFLFPASSLSSRLASLRASLHWAPSKTLARLASPTLHRASSAAARARTHSWASS